MVDTVAMAVTETVSKSEPEAGSSWYLVYTKPRQEFLALQNLQQQGYTCYLPQWKVERIQRKLVSVSDQPLFPRYLFIQLSSSMQGKSWAPVRYTTGVSGLVSFGHSPAQVDAGLVQLLQQREQAMQLQTLFQPGDRVTITEGPFAGIHAIYQTQDAQRRSMILLDILSKPVTMKVDTGSLKKQT
jgi:transcriptional antiterminator RfaH